MSRSQILIFAGLFLLLVGGLPACSTQTTPRQIASYPFSTPYPEVPLKSVYDTYLELEVPDVEKAEEKVIDITYRVGGLLVDSRSWEQQGRKHTTLVLAVPAARSDMLRSHLYALGTTELEQISSRVIRQADNAAGTWTYFTIHLQAESRVLPAFPPTGWHPMRTLERAWGVFVTIFGFLVDSLIWFSVVLGPFILVGLGIRVIIHRCRS